MSAVTYNFDPDLWYDNQRRALDLRRAHGEIEATAFEAEVERLEARYDQMRRRLDAPFELPGPASNNDEG
jgi:hypothetical protein